MTEHRYTFEIGELGVRVFHTVRMLRDIAFDDLLKGLNNGRYLTTTHHSEGGFPGIYETATDDTVAHIIDQAIEVDEPYINFEPEGSE